MKIKIHTLELELPEGAKIEILPDGAVDVTTGDGSRIHIAKQAKPDDSVQPSKPAEVHHHHHYHWNYGWNWRQVVTPIYVPPNVVQVTPEMLANSVLTENCNNSLGPFTVKGSFTLH